MNTASLPLLFTMMDTRKGIIIIIMWSTWHVIYMDKVIMALNFSFRVLRGTRKKFYKQVNRRMSAYRMRNDCLPERNALKAYFGRHNTSLMSARLYVHRYVTFVSCDYMKTYTNNCGVARMLKHSAKRHFKVIQKDATIFWSRYPSPGKMISWTTRLQPRTPPPKMNGIRNYVLFFTLSHSKVYYLLQDFMPGFSHRNSQVMFDVRTDSTEL